MRTVKIECNGKQGTIVYNPETKKAEVFFKNEKVRKKIIKYLNTKREYQIDNPDKSIIDGGKIETEYPFKSDFHFMAAVCSMGARIDVFLV